jgi:hypothetical protein
MSKIDFPKKLSPQKIKNRFLYSPFLQNSSLSIFEIYIIPILKDTTPDLSEIIYSQFYNKIDTDNYLNIL